MNERDKYQGRYLAHQQRKASILKQLLNERHSTRVFAERAVTDDDIQRVLDLVSNAPSSCDRKGVTIHVETDRDRKALLGGLLVGGVGWIHRAPVILLLFADPTAYKAGDEIFYMPYLDAGVIVGELGIVLQSQGLVGCFVNPNIRSINEKHFSSTFSGHNIFCGAMAVGHRRGTDPEWVGDTS